jgi:ATP-dependent DNA helicase RecG
MQNWVFFICSVKKDWQHIFMDIEQLKELVIGGESHRLEFKKSTASLSAAFQTLDAFLNNDGGTILIGVTDDGKIVGQEVTDKNQRAISHEISKIEPPAKIEVTYVPIADTGLQVIVLQALSSIHKPYVYEGRPYYREQTTTKQMPQQLYDQLVAQRFQLNFSWENCVAENYETQDLDNDLLLGVVRTAVETKRMPEEALRQTIPELLRALKLSTTDHQINNAAVALFSKKITGNYLQCRLKMARFKGIDSTEFIDEEHVDGNVFQLLESGMMFVKRHLPIAAKIMPGKLERVETPLIPFVAIREVLINALCHRNYAVYGGSIGLAIYDDRMEIFNNGGLPPGISLQKVKLGYSEPRNPLIANVFYRSNLIEGWGRGIPNIIKSCLDANDPEPQFIVDTVEFKVIFRFPSSLKPPVLTVGADLSYEEFSARQKEILNILAKHSGLSTKGILEKFQNVVSERTLRNDLSELESKKIIRSKGQTNNRTWSIITDH